MEFHSCLSSFPVYYLITVRICVPRRQYGFAFAWKAGEDDRTFRLWPSPFFPLASGSWLKLHESPVEHCPCAFHWKHSNTFISPQALFLFWLSATDPRSTTSFRILKFQFLIIWSFWSFAPVFNCWWFRGPLFRATSWSNKAITIWSWTEVCYFDLYNPSRIDGEDISPTVKSAWSHRTSKSRTSSSFCKLVANNFASPCTASRAPVARKTQKSCTQLAFLERIGRNYQLLLSDTFSYSEVWLRAEMLLQGWRNHRMKQIEIGKIRLPCNRSRCHKFVNWCGNLNFFDPEHNDLRIGWS